MIGTEVEVVLSVDGNMVAQFAGTLQRSEEIMGHPDAPAFFHVGEGGFTGFALSASTCDGIQLYEPAHGAGASVLVMVSGARVRVIQR